MDIAAYVGGYLCFEGSTTDEGWYFSRAHHIGCFETRPLPITLFDQPLNAGHDHSIAIGSITRLWRQPLVSGAVGIRWIGTISNTLEGRRALAAIEDPKNKDRNFLSADLMETRIHVEEVPSASTASLFEDYYNETTGEIEQRKVTYNLTAVNKEIYSAVLFGGTLLSVAGAYPGANSKVISEKEYNAFLSATDLADVTETRHETIDAWKSLNASGTYQPRVYDRNVFFADEAAEPTKLTVVPGTRLVQGHLGTWDTCHRGYDGCVTMPRGVSYDQFHLTPLKCSDGGTVLVGPLTLGEGHTPDDIDSKWHHENVLSAIADVRITEGVFGPWVSGILRDSASAADIERLVKSHPSGEWRENLTQCVAMMLVVNPGFPVKETEKPPLTASNSCSCQHEDLVEDENVAAAKKVLAGIRERVESLKTT